MKSSIYMSIAILLLFHTFVGAYPAPIEKPAQTTEKVLEIALKYSKKNNMKLKKEHSQFFVKLVSYEVFDPKKHPGHNLKDEEVEKLKQKLGWRVEILRRNDLSQCDILFVDQSGKVVTYWQWH